jgi:hypothetical protein
MKIVLTVGLVLVWIVMMQANIGWVGAEAARLQVGQGLSAEDAGRRVIRRTILFACLYTAAGLYVGWRIWR